MPADGDVEMLRQVLDGFNEHDLDAIMAHFAEDCVFDSPRGPDRWGRRFAGKDQVRCGLAARFEGIPDVRYVDDDHFACGTRGVSEWTISGTSVDGGAYRCARVRPVDIRARRHDCPQGQLLEDPRHVNPAPRSTAGDALARCTTAAGAGWLPRPGPDVPVTW